MGHKATPAQQRIFDFVENGSGNGIIDAVAGAGKTTTLMGCVKHAPDIKDVIYCAFNTSIRKELQKKFHAVKMSVKVSTIHSLGFALLRATGDFEVDDSKYHNIIKDPEFFDRLVPEIDKILEFHNKIPVAEIRRLQENKDILDWDDKNSLNESEKYVSKIINRLLNINQKYRCTLTDKSIEAYDEMVRHFGIFEDFELMCASYSNELQCYYSAHQKLIKEGNSIAISHGIIDFTDQLYLPFALNLTSKDKYGFVFVDECQDLSRAQLYVVKQYIREDGRLLAVGDPYQSIYGFAGADCESFDRIKSAFNCQLLGLTDCFRCPQSVIKLAQSIRPDINGFKDYPGKLYQIHQYEVVANVKAGDLIICRARKPLMDMALKLITKDFKVKIHPDELQEFMGDYKRNFTHKELRAILTEDMVDEFFEAILARNKERVVKECSNADSVLRNMMIKEETLRIENTLNFIKKKFFEWKLNTVDTILTRLKHTLSYPGEDAIKISSIHRAKGLENDRVFILEYNKMPLKQKLPWGCVQERNLHYVAVTRPKEELYLCDDQLYTDGDGDAIEQDLKPAEPINASSETFNAILDEAKASTTHITEQKVSEIVLSDNLNDGDSIVSAESEDAKSTETVFVPVSSFINIHNTVRISKIPEKFYSFDEYEDTPYASLNNNSFQKAKYWSLFDHLQDTEYSIYKVVSSQYLDVYYINTPNGIEAYNGSYKASGQFTFRPQGNCINAEKLLQRLNDESNYKIKFEYHPQSHGFEAIHEVIQAACQELVICNTNIFNQAYSLVYCFATGNSYAYINVVYDGRNVITQIMPNSTLGESDEKLNTLLNMLKHLWQQ